MLTMMVPLILGKNYVNLMAGIVGKLLSQLFHTILTSCARPIIKMIDDH